jgi:serine protease SohB
MFNWGKYKKNFISVTSLNDIYASTVNDVSLALGEEPKFLRRKYKANRIFVLDFEGDTLASQASALASEITAVICNAKDGDQVLVRLNSPGGAAHTYGYAAAQLARIKNAKIPLVIAVDKIAASGGYLMACVSDKILASPWAIIGSVGVVSEFPNFFQLLQNLGVEYKQYTAGAFKRTVSPLGPLTQEGEAKFKENLLGVYQAFCQHIIHNRPCLTEHISEIATGEHWNGLDAFRLKLVDELKTSDEYILENISKYEIVKIKYLGEKRGFVDKLSSNFVTTLAEVLVKQFHTAWSNFFYARWM